MYQLRSRPPLGRRIIEYAVILALACIALVLVMLVLGGEVWDVTAAGAASISWG